LSYQIIILLDLQQLDLNPYHRRQLNKTRTQLQAYIKHAVSIQREITLINK